ncbi:MAG: magnesium/cobalt transporter CorA [Bacteroidota bacterium]|nr:magnesium/cobalt transporter CorA [Bacteroidota bacterium]
MKKVHKRSGKAGLPPGSFIHVGAGPITPTKSGLFIYNETDVQEIQNIDVTDFVQSDPDQRITWLDIDGLMDEPVLRSVGKRFDLHTLLLEDVLNTDHRPKVEEYQDTLFIVAKMLDLDHETGAIISEQISFVLRKNLLVSFQEKPGDVLDPIRERLRQGTGRARRSGADYLLYALLDVIVDNYFIIVEDLGRRIEELERKVLVRPGNEDLIAIQELRSHLITVNRYVTPTRELAGRLNSIQSPLIDKSTRRYINDLQDHTVYIAETIAMFREMLGSLENTYHAGVNLRTGQVMKLLTIISTIFIPLTFIVGIYGMNFQNMPELTWRYGYHTVMAFMLVISLLMLAWFRWKRWL